MGLFSNILKAAIIAAAVATGVGMVAGLQAVGSATFMGLTGASAYFATSLVTTFVLGAVSASLAKSPSSQTALSSGALASTRDALAPHKIIYGRSRTGGTIVYLESTSSNKYLHIVVALAGHEIDAVEKVYFGDEEVTLDGSGNISGGTYFGKARVKFKYGTDSQTAFEDLVSESDGNWTANHRMKGRAAAYIRLEYDQNVYPNGMPNFSFLIRGKKVYDPRSDTTAWSNNPALCISDYLCDVKRGMGCVYADEIDETALIAAANICDTDVALSAGGYEDKYRLDGFFLTSASPEEIINQMLTSMAGKAVWSNGKWRILAGHYYTPTLTFDEGDLRSGFTVQTLVSRRENFNGVKGVFVSSDNNYISTDFPSIQSATAVSEDGGEEVYKNISLPFTTSATMAQRLAKIELLRARQQITLTLPMKLQGLKANVGDIVEIDNKRLGWSNKPFEVVSMNVSIAEALGVDLELREISSDVFDWQTSEEQTFDPAPNTNLPNAFDVTAPGISVVDTLEINAETIVTKLVVNLTGGDTFNDRFEVQAKPQSSSDWLNLGQATGAVFQLYNVIDSALYDVRARAINVFGVRSDWTTSVHEVIGKTAPPEDVTGFSINVVGTQAYLTWNPVSDLDLSHYRIRHSRLTTGATYTDAIDVVAKVPRPGVFAVVPAMTGTYFIKAIDKLGNESLNVAEIVAIIEDIKGLNFIETITESPSFSGSKVECNVNENGYLILDTSIDFDSATGLFDSYFGDFDGGGGTISTEGTYTFANVVDLGAVYTSRVTSNITVGRVDYVNLFDDKTGLFDDQHGLFDGDPNTYGDTNVKFYISTTEDDPNGTPTWTDYRIFLVGDYKARGLRFKIILTSESGDASPFVSDLSVSIDMPDRVASGDDLVSGAGAYAVTFSPAFKVAPALGIAAQNMVQGDYYEITSKSASGFTITFKNSGGTAVSRTFDYVAKGYGELAA